jgi:hypothetical protein
MPTLSETKIRFAIFLTKSGEHHFVQSLSKINYWGNNKEGEINIHINEYIIN